MERNNQHVEEERLEAYAMNALANEEEVAIIEEHLLVCETCQDQLEAVEHHVRAMQGAAKRIRQEEIQTPVTTGVLDRLNVWNRIGARRIEQWFRTPVRKWSAGLSLAAVAMASLILMIGLPLREKPGPPVDVELMAIRGAPTQFALAGHALHLRLDNRGVPELNAWRIEIVDEDGAKVWNGFGGWSNSFILASVDRSFSPGTYFVRLLKDGEDPVREYELIVQKPPTNQN